MKETKIITVICNGFSFFICMATLFIVCHNWDLLFAIPIAFAIATALSVIAVISDKRSIISWLMLLVAIALLLLSSWLALWGYFLGSNWRN
ncbi:hypothetical protein ACI6Q2_09660 [Chitinophagaceae bacterium LWZ2-11]